jgi:Ca-activated chloride channel homolog
MKMTRALLAALFAVSVVTAQEPSKQAPVFRSTADTVPVFVTVTDKSGKLVPDLQRDAFQVYDNGKAQTVTLFDNSPQPVRLIVMLDVSGSMSGNLRLVRAACQELFQHLRVDDQVKVGTFGNSIDISPEFTRDQNKLLAALPTDIPASAPTPLWRGIDQAVGDFGDSNGRRVVLVLSDGKDSNIGKFGQKYISQLDVIDRAQREDVMIYGVGLRSRSAGGMMGPQSLLEDLPDPGLGTVALDTGGGYVEILPRDDLAAAFGRVADELHQQYLIGYTTPTRDGKMHKVEVKMKDGSLKPRTRKNYLATGKK